MKVSEEELTAAITGVFGTVPTDELQQRVFALCEGLYDESDERSLLDRQWAERVYPEFERWLQRLKVLECRYQERVDAFLKHCQQTVRVAELFDEFAQQRMDRTWTAATEYFESVMPQELLTFETADFSIDIDSKCAWWTAADGDVGLELPVVFSECLHKAGEFSSDSARSLTELCVDAMCDGSAPLPGFQFQHIQDGVAPWKWVSPEQESADADLKGDESASAMEDEVLILCDDFPRAVAQLQMSGYGPLPADAAAHIPALVQHVCQYGLSSNVVLREIGGPLSMRACQALQRGDTLGFQRAFGAIETLKCELDRPTGAFTAE